jgi:hypothetical protein
MRTRVALTTVLLTTVLMAGCSYFAEGKTDTDDFGSDDEAWTPTDTGEPSTDTGPTDTGSAVSDCPQPTTPISLAEAWDRGYADISFDGALQIDNVGPHEISIENWHLFLTPTSQDAAAGDADINYETGTATGRVIDPGDTWTHYYTSSTGPAWWCIERTQVTTYADDFIFNGSQAPVPLMDFIHTLTDTNANSVEDHGEYPDPVYTTAPQTQFNVWDAISEGPVLAIGRTPNYIELHPGESGTLTVEVLNLGRGMGTVEVSETIPAGTEAHSFSVTPTRTSDNTDGSTTITWEFKMPGSEDDPDTSMPTTYDSIDISYGITMLDADCGQRMTTWAPQVSWQDIWERPFVSYGTPLVIACCE